MHAPAAAAAAAQKRVKRAMGLLRAAAPLLEELAQDLDVVAEVHLRPDDPPALLLEALEHARRLHRGDLDVVILGRGRTHRP